MTEPAPTAPDREATAPPTLAPVPSALPPDPLAYDSVRAQHARARGLKAPYIPGGRDPEPEAGRREERFLLRLLLLMVVAVGLGGFVIGIAIALLSGVGA